MNIGIRIPNWIGDAILAIPFIKTLRKIYKNNNIFIIGRESPLTIFFNNPYVDYLIHLNDKEEGIIKSGFKLRKYKIDIMFILPTSLSSAIIGYLSGSKIRVGYKKEMRNILLSYSYKLPEEKIHRSKQYLYLLKYFNKIDIENIKLESRLYLSKEEIKRGKNILSRVINNKRKIIGLNPNCSAISRKWPGEKFAKLADILNKKYNIIFFGSKKEKEYVDNIISMIEDRDKIINLSGIINLREYISILSLIDLFITNDSGPMHIANSVGTSLIALEGPADVHETGVINNYPHIYISKNLPCSPCVKNVCPYSHNNCMKLIEVDEVVEAVKKIL